MTQQNKRKILAIGFLSSWLASGAGTAVALPPATDQPEEVLRTEIITGARSPINGKPMTASEYAQLQTELRTPPPTPPQVAPKVRKTVGLLKLRKFIKTFFPFIPIR